MIRRITEAHVEHLAFKTAREKLSAHEPIPDFSTRSPALLDSSLNAPFQTVGGKLAYPGLVQKGSALLYFLVKNHPFQNGNKRIGMMSLLAFLWLNGKWLDINNDMFYVLPIMVAQSHRDEKDKMVKFIGCVIKSFIVPYPFSS